MEFIMTVATVFICVALCAFVFRLMVVAHGDAVSNGAPANLLFSAIPILALALSAYMPVGYLRLEQAIAESDMWSSHFVLHIPTASDFWLDYIPAHWQGTTRNYLVLGTLLLAIGIFVLIKASMVEEGRDFFKRYSAVTIYAWVIAMSFVVFLVAQVFVFLSAYFIATLIIVGSQWKVILLLLFLAAAGGGAAGGKKIYDEHGRHIGNLKD